MPGEHAPIPTQTEVAGKQLLDAAFHVHTQLGPGLLESVYEECLCRTLQRRGIPFERQPLLPIEFDGETVDAGLRLDVLVNELVVGELKAVDQFAPIHQAQLMTYLRLSQKRLGFLINFNVLHLRDGIKRIVN